MADVRQYCAEGIAESDACGDVEMHAEFLLQGALLNMADGRGVRETKEMLQVGSQILYPFMEVDKLLRDLALY